MNNAVFGKTMGNVQNKLGMKFTLDEDYALKYVSKLRQRQQIHKWRIYD